MKREYVTTKVIKNHKKKIDKKRNVIKQCLKRYCTTSKTSILPTRQKRFSEGITYLLR